MDLKSIFRGNKESDPQPGLSQRPGESWDSYIRRVPFKAPPGGEWRVLAHDSYEWPTKLYETEEERESYMAAAERVIDRMLEDPEAYFREAEEMSVEECEHRIDAALANPEISSTLGLGSAAITGVK